MNSVSLNRFSSFKVSMVTLRKFFDGNFTISRITLVPIVVWTNFLFASLRCAQNV